MTNNQLIQLLTQHSIRIAATNTTELGVQCPRCSPLHQNNRLTLYINQQTNRWLCYRCEPRLAGHNLKNFLQLFKLERYANQSTIAPIIDQYTFEHATAFSAQTTTNAQPPINLPIEFRHDWQATYTGKTILHYLKSRISTAAINVSKVGYAVSGPAAGRAIFPVILHQQLQFWQARQVMFNNNLKYINPPNARKSHVLYGYDWLTPHKEVVITEGIFDALNITNAVAIFGKTISDHQIALLAKKHIMNIQVQLDGDAIIAARHLAHQLINKLPNIQTITIAQLHPNDDPATATKIINLIKLNF